MTRIDELSGEIVALRIICERLLLTQTITSKDPKNEVISEYDAAMLSLEKIDLGKSPSADDVRSYASTVLDNVYTVVRSHIR